jgi:hypothetical protein
MNALASLGNRNDHEATSVLEPKRFRFNRFLWKLDLSLEFAIEDFQEMNALARPGAVLWFVPHTLDEQAVAARHVADAKVFGPNAGQFNLQDELSGVFLEVHSGLPLRSASWDRRGARESMMQPLEALLHLPIPVFEFSPRHFSSFYRCVATLAARNRRLLGRDERS